MSRIGNAWRALVGDTAQPQPKTRILPGQEEKNPWQRLGLDDKEDRRKKIQRFLKAYKRGGPAADAIDAYPLFSLTNGYDLVCEEGKEELKDRVQEWLDQPHVDIEGWIWEAITSAILAGDSYQELIQTRGGIPWGVVTRDPSSFSKDFDDYGRVTGYTQHLPVGPGGLTEKEIPIEKERIINLILFKVPGSVYGQSIWDRAEDDILRDCDVYESLTKAMHRHGTPKQQWDGGTPEAPLSDADILEVERQIKKVDALTDFVTTGIKINSLDTTGITGATEFSNMSLQRMACALGVPEEMLGLGRGSTEATATVRMAAFLDKVSTIQNIVARTYSRQLIDKITGVSGAVWIEFKDVSPDDELKKADVILKLATAGGMDPEMYCPRDWAREQFGIEADESYDQIPTEQEEWNSVGGRVDHVPGGKMDPKVIGKKPQEQVI